jgi:adenine-specific DNA-methyltransferase
VKQTTAKRQGIHYTPPELAQFLAALLWAQSTAGDGQLRVLDPACGDGALLAAFARAVPANLARRLTLVGYETDNSAIAAARRTLRPLAIGQFKLIESDFLRAACGPESSSPARVGGATADAGFDVVIANPPYVRTQVLGARQAGRLAKQFGLTGRVDLYYAFARAMADVLRPGGTLGLLVSNRFLTIKSGSALRAMLRTQFALDAIYDLGDTKLFAAAVLPAIIVATKQTPTTAACCRFDRVYRHRVEKERSEQPNSGESIPAVSSILSALGDGRTTGLVRAPTGLFHLERGFLADRRPDGIWTLSNAKSKSWLKTVERHVDRRFDDVGRVRVGIKTTADEVFIRDDWDSLPLDERPEPELLRPLLRHFSAARWLSGPQRQAVLYPHLVINGQRAVVDLAAFPNASRYFQRHRRRLTRRKYVIDSGREWYEIWVPHNPADWSLPKIVFPDIAAESRFFLDRCGAVVNGDCYWITLRPGQEADWLLLMLAVANSSFITRFYDIAFHNQLYAGRRRFMTQYVKQFPLPAISSRAAQRAIACARQLVALVDTPSEMPNPLESAEPTGTPKKAHELEREIDEQVWEAFGLEDRIDS